MTNIKITCIIPAYNEQDRIGHVLGVICDHPMIDEIIVINDGSTDKTAEVITGFKNITLITNKTNQGKNIAMTIGINKARNDHLMFIDSDLLYLSADDITRLIAPVDEGKADMSMSLRKNTPWHWVGMDYIAGERLVPKELLQDHLEEIRKLPSYGIEVFMNRLLIKKRYRICVVQWPKVESPIKAKKVGLAKGACGEVKMIWQILQTVTPFEIVYQIIMMKRRQTNRGESDARFAK